VAKRISEQRDSSFRNRWEKLPESVGIPGKLMPQKLHFERQILLFVAIFLDICMIGAPLNMPQTA
jgi:hypothetical protein